MKRIAIALLLVGCTGELRLDDDGGGAAMDASRPPGTDAGSFDAGDVDAAGRDAGGPPPGLDAGPCAGGLVEDFSVTPIAGLPTSDGAHAAATPDGLVVATSGASGVTLTWVDWTGATLGTASVAGNRAWGVAADDGGAAGVLVDRSSDEMWAVVVERDGSPRFEQRLLGGVSHDVTNNEWFGTGIRAGRMTWTGSQWATYHTVQRLWNDGIAHYGDTLRFLDASTGAAAGGGWGWGCSHSMEVRIAQSATRTGPLCVSDCFPGKGVYFDHNTELFVDPSGNCAGRIDTRIGGIATQSGGFLASFSSPNGRSSADVALVAVGDDRRAMPPVWLTEDGTDDTDVHAARFGSGALVGWVAGGTDRLARVDASGAPVGAAVDVPGAGLARASDFVELDGGDVAWVTGAGSTLAIARVRACE
ncbi:MAG: hypothetical protein H6719_32035 [Sandaracinaceae bacterium]|nr:hypothetical protein [Sandaracinaceae bacterium]